MLDVRVVWMLDDYVCLDFKLLKWLSDFNVSFSDKNVY